MIKLEPWIINAQEGIHGRQEHKRKIISWEERLMENKKQSKLEGPRSEGFNIGMESQDGSTSFGVNQSAKILTCNERGNRKGRVRLYEYLWGKR